MEAFNYQQVKDHLDDALANEITEFWLKEGAMNNADAAKDRLPQVMFVAREADSQALAAVSSVYPQYNEQLKNHFFYMRVFVPPRFKNSDIGEQLIIRIRDLLNSDYEQGKQQKCIGVMLEIHDPAIKHAYPEAIWPESQMVYIGKNTQGAQLRVHYFTHALIA